MHFNTPVIAKLRALLGRSDHACVVADFLQAPLHREPTTSRRVWRYNQADWPRLCKFFREQTGQQLSLMTLTAHASY